MRSTCLLIAVALVSVHIGAAQGTPCCWDEDCPLTNQVCTAEGYCGFDCGSGLDCPDGDDTECPDGYFCDVASLCCDWIASSGGCGAVVTRKGFAPTYRCDPPPGTPCGVCGTIQSDGVTCYDPCARCGGYADCQYGASSCAGTGMGCDSNGCCTLTSSSCRTPSSFCNPIYNCTGQCACNQGCPVGWTQVGDCCEPPNFGCGGDWACSTDADCAQWDEVCDGGCCGCSPSRYTPCGSSGCGYIQCDGTCGGDSCACDMGASCNNCGTYQCDGSCLDPCPNQPGSSCGGCGSYESDGATCNDPCNGCNPGMGQSCGSCGTVDCNLNWTCDDPCYCVDYGGSDCGVCGSLQCNGSCDDPCGCGGYNSPCGGCGQYQCNGTCNDPCNGCNPSAGSSCGNCGVVQCDGSCNDSCS